MKTVLADTNYWVALLNPRDQLHAKAMSVSSSLGPVQIVTTEMILAELLNDYAKRGKALRRAAVELIEQLRNDRNATIGNGKRDRFDY